MFFYMGVELRVSFEAKVNRLKEFENRVLNRTFGLLKEDGRLA
jgi:hypothetical protein